MNGWNTQKASSRITRERDQQRRQQVAAPALAHRARPGSRRRAARCGRRLPPSAGSGAPARAPTAAIPATMPSVKRPSRNCGRHRLGHRRPERLAAALVDPRVAEHREAAARRRDEEQHAVALGGRRHPELLEDARAGAPGVLDRLLARRARGSRPACATPPRGSRPRSARRRARSTNASAWLHRSPSPAARGAAAAEGAPAPREAAAPAAESCPRRTSRRPQPPKPPPPQ